MVVFSIFGKRPSSFSVYGMEGYICFMVLMVSGDWDVITWSLLAFVLIGLGIWLKERAHRLYGLVILAVSSGYLVLIAFNHLEGAARILTLIGMGVILILLGLAYTKNQEKLREIL